MIKLEEVFADFQMIGHRVLESTFRCPSKYENDSDLSFEFDFEILKTEEQEDRYFGLVGFQIVVKVSCEDAFEEIVDCLLEAAFIGNPPAMTFENFSDMLSINGVATISQMARAYILNLTTMSGLKMPILVPMINVIELKAKKDEALLNQQKSKSKGKKNKPST